MLLNNIIIKPIITEKSMAANQNGRYTFLVDKNATKKQIKMAIEEQFKVNIVSVKTVIVKGKKKRIGKKRSEVQGSSKKKAIVELLPEQKIEAFEMGGK